MFENYKPCIIILKNQKKNVKGNVCVCVCVVVVVVIEVVVVVVIYKPFWFCIGTWAIFMNI